MKTDNRTKGTWFTTKAINDSEIIISSTDGNVDIASLYSLPLDEQTQANAEYICKAVNEREELIEALRELTTRIDKIVNAKDEGDSLRTATINKHYIADAEFYSRQAKSLLTKAEQ